MWGPGIRLPHTNKVHSINGARYRQRRLTPNDALAASVLKAVRPLEAQESAAKSVPLTGTWCFLQSRSGDEKVFIVCLFVCLFACFHKYRRVNTGGRVVVKALCYKPVRDPMRWMNSFSICLILPAALGPGVHSVSYRNEYQIHKNNIF
jgi:hypothetical protein